METITEIRFYPTAAVSCLRNNIMTVFPATNTISILTAHIRHQNISKNTAVIKTTGLRGDQKKWFITILIVRQTTRQKLIKVRHQTSVICEITTS